MTTVADILEEAAGLIETVGWTRGQAVLRDVNYQPIGYCAVGAIGAVAGMAKIDIVHAGHAEHVFQAWLMAKGFLSIPDWNDHYAGDSAEVVDTMKLVAKDLRNEAKL